MSEQLSDGSSSMLGGLPLLFAIVILACFLLAIIPSKIAKRKGYSDVGFYFFGLAAFVPAIIVASCLRNRNVVQQSASPAKKETTDVASELERYADLLSRGVITQDEFDELKRKFIEKQ